MTVRGARLRSAGALILLAVTALLFAGCAAVPPVFRPLPDGWEGAMARAAECDQAPQSLVARASVRFEDGGTVHTASAWIVIEFPDSLRLELQDPFGRTVYYVVAAGGTIRALDALAGAYYEGPATPENVARFLTAPMEVSDVVRVASGLVLRDRTLAPDGTAPDGMWVFVDKEEGGPDRWRIAIDPDGFRAVRASLGMGDGTVALAEFDDFRGDDGCARPRKIRLTTVESGAKVHIIFSTQQWNRAPEPGAFELPVPDGVHIIPLPGTMRGDR